MKLCPLSASRSLVQSLTMKAIFTVLAAVALLVAGCRVSDKREMTVNLPGMASQADIETVRKAVTALPGIEKDSLAFSNGRLTLTYDSMQVAKKNIEIAIAEAGFDANGIKAVPQKK
jgi:Copper chaperone